MTGGASARTSYPPAQQLGPVAARTWPLTLPAAGQALHGLGWWGHITGCWSTWPKREALSGWLLARIRVDPITAGPPGASSRAGMDRRPGWSAAWSPAAAHLPVPSPAPGAARRDEAAATGPAAPSQVGRIWCAWRSRRASRLSVRVEPEPPWAGEVRIAVAQAHDHGIELARVGAADLELDGLARRDRESVGVPGDGRARHLDHQRVGFQNSASGADLRR
jgi:hypothetical protein